jgi:hypothetical protein
MKVILLITLRLVLPAVFELINAQAEKRQMTNLRPDQRSSYHGLLTLLSSCTCPTSPIGSARRRGEARSPEAKDLGSVYLTWTDEETYANEGEDRRYHHPVHTKRSSVLDGDG